MSKPMNETSNGTRCSGCIAAAADAAAVAVRVVAVRAAVVFFFGF